MSEYKYYEFCSLYKPLSEKLRKEMVSLASIAKIRTHGVSYKYSHEDFSSDPKKLLLKYFDVFFYLCNSGRLQLLFKYPVDEININQIKKFYIKKVISTKIQKDNFLLSIEIEVEGGTGWADPEEMLIYFLPLYDEIKAGNYKFLKFISSIHERSVNTENLTKIVDQKLKVLSAAQKAFLGIFVCK